MTFGGYAGKAAPHHITMRNITIKSSCRGSATSASSNPTDHAFYISEAVGGPHDLKFYGINVDGRGGLATAFHFYHSSGSNKNAWNVTIQGLHVTKTQQAVMLWDPTLRNIKVTSARIVGAMRYAIRIEGGSAITISLHHLDGIRDRPASTAPRVRIPRASRCPTTASSSHPPDRPNGQVRRSSIYSGRDRTPSVDSSPHRP